MNMTSFIKVVERLSIQERLELAEELLDILLSSVNLEKVQDDVGWKINESYREGKLSDAEFLGEIAYAVSIAEPSKLRKIIERLGVKWEDGRLLY